MYELDKLITEGMSESDFEATRAFLSKYVALLTDGQSRQLGYALDSKYYEIGPFSDYVRDALGKLTLDDVNRVIRENLSTDNVQYVFITRDAADLKARLADEQASPMTYEADMPEEVLAEDREIAELALGITGEKVSIKAAEEVFH